MKNIILVGVDSSDTAFEAARKAAQLAVGLECELHILTAFVLDESGIPSVRSSGSRAEVEAAVEKRNTAIARYASHAKGVAASVGEKLHELFPDLIIEPKGVRGGPAAALVSEARRIDARVVVVGNKRVQRPSRVLGSIASAVARSVSCDLYVANTHTN